MALTVSLSQASPGNWVSNRSMMVAMTVTNTGASAVTVSTISLLEATESDAQIGFPQGFLTPNVPAGLGNPVLAAGASGTYMWPVVINSPSAAGPSPQHQPGSASPSPLAPAADAVFTLQGQAASSDGSIATTNMQVSVLATIVYDPPPQGGGTWFSQGANSNLLAVL